jgi:hypothetical protein
VIGFPFGPVISGAALAAFDMLSRHLQLDGYQTPSRRSPNRRRSVGGRRGWVRFVPSVRLESLEQRVVLAPVVFGPQVLIDGLDADGPTRAQPVDLDGDGDMDLLVSSYRDGGVSWYENDGTGQFRTHRIALDAPQARDVVAADFDGDGDLDVAVAAYASNSVLWYENLGADGFGPARTITSDARGVRTLAVADLDSDGDLDLVSGSWFDDKVAWYANDGAGNFGAQQIIANDTDGVRSIRVGDLDGDGLPDVAVASRLDDTVSWFRNMGGGNFGPKQPLPFTGNGPEAIELYDIDGDGDLDLFLARYWDNTISWFENDGTGNFSAPVDVSTRAERGQSVAVADLDGDGHGDLIAASYYYLDNKIVWFANTDGQGTFGPERFISVDAPGVEHVAAADFDGDGVVDVVAASTIDNNVSWFRNDGTGSFDRQRDVLSDASGAASVSLADLDGDGDLDVLVAAYWDNEIAWYENLDGNATFGPQQVISNAAQRAQMARAADIDGDGQLDILSASYADGKIAWYRNLGNGSFGSQQIISNRLTGATAIVAADFDGDGDIDVAAASFSTGIVSWFENLDGRGSFGPLQILTRGAIGAERLQAVDLDGDGDLDLIAAAYGSENISNDGEVLWFENIGGNATFGPANTLVAGGGPTAVQALDLDGDGDLDLVVTHYETRRLVWYENQGDLTFGNAQIIAETLDRLEALELADIDGNGTLDLLVGSGSAVYWFERLGNGEFRVQLISSRVDWVFEVAAGDLNGDGRTDVVSASFQDSKIAMYLNQSQPGDFDADGNLDAADVDLLCAAIQAGDADPLFDLNGDGQVSRGDMDFMINNLLQTSYGDANLDGVFNSRDLVAIFQAGKYETGVPGDASWVEGDWNCDGQFTTADLILAFENGGYTTAATLPTRKATAFLA